MTPSAPRNDSVTPERYYHKKLDWVPKTNHTKDKWLGIYEEYITNTMTTGQLAKKHGLDRKTITRMLKWATFTLTPKIDDKAKLKERVDTAKHRIQTLEKDIRECNNQKDKGKFRDLIYKYDRFISQLEGLLSTAKVDMSTKQKIVVVQHINRRTGSGKPAEKQAEAEVVNDK